MWRGSESNESAGAQRLLAYAVAVAAPAAFTRLVVAVPTWPKPYSWQFLIITMLVAFLGGVAPGAVALAGSLGFVILLGVPTPVHPGAEMFAITGVILLGLLRRSRLTKEKLAATVAALEESQATLDGFFASAPAVLTLLDDELRYINTDAMTPAYFGLDRDSIRGCSLEELAPEFAAEFGPVMRKVLDTGEPQLEVDVHGQVPSRGGETAHFAASFFPVPLAGGSRALGSIAVDVTHVKDAEAALRESTTLLRAISDESADAIFAKDLAGRIAFANPATLALIGKPADAVLGRTDAELLDDSDAARRVMENDRRIMETGVPTELEETFPMPGGGMSVWLSRKSPYRDADGRVIGLLGISRDITDRKREMERAAFLSDASHVLVSSLDYAATLQRVVDLAVPSIADCCTVQIVNEAQQCDCVAAAHVDPAKLAAARAFKASPGHPSGPFDPAAAIQRAEPVLIASVADAPVDAAGGDQARLELLRTLAPCSYICVPLVAHGRTLGALTLMTAESGRRYGGDELRLASDVAYRVALAIDNAQLYEQGQIANRVKDEFLATLSHELRTPLNAILGYSRLLRLGALPAERQTGAVDAVERNARALTKIVDDVLDVSRIVAGKVRLDVQPVDVSFVVANAVETVRPAADAKGIRVQMTMEPNAGIVSGDPDRIQQIVWNLLSNAVKFTTHGGVVQVAVASVESDVEIAVTDSGIGIAPAFLPFVFERFRQADSSTKRERGGLGLGLAIVRHLAELHGGTVAASSGGEGCGATFRVRLPVMGVTAGSEAAVERRLLSADDRDFGAARSGLHGLRVLAVDDDRDALELVHEILTAAGAKVAIASSGREALETLTAFRPDVLITDIAMPEMDGFELIAHVRQSADASIRRIPAAAVTAYARSEDRAKSLLRGFQTHLAKPVDPLELVAATAALASGPGGDLTLDEAATSGG